MAICFLADTGESQWQSYNFTSHGTTRSSHISSIFAPRPVSLLWVPQLDLFFLCIHWRLLAKTGRRCILLQGKRDVAASTNLWRSRAFHNYLTVYFTLGEEHIVLYFITCMDVRVYGLKKLCGLALSIWHSRDG